MNGADLLRTSASVPGFALRILTVGVAVPAALMLIPFPLWHVIVTLLAVMGACFPQTYGTWLAAACLPLGMLFTEVDAGRAALAMLAVYLLHVLASLSREIPLRSRVVLRALRPSVKRLVAVQVPAQALLLIVLVLVPSASGPGQAWAAALGGAAVLLLTLVLLSVLRRTAP